MKTYSHKKHKLLLYSSGVLQLLIGLSAVAGGFRLVMNPGGTLDIPIEWLNESPFTSYFIPGLLLTIVIGFGNILASLISFLHKSYSWYTTTALGLALIGFMSIEIWFVGLRNFLQPLYLIFGFIGLIIGIALKNSISSLPSNLKIDELQEYSHR